MRPSMAMAPRPAFSGRSKAAMIARARSPRRGGCEDRFAPSIWLGWISVLPSKPQSRPCSHSARKPPHPRVRCRPRRGCRGRARGRRRAPSSATAASAACPGARRARVSLARSLVPITKQSSRVSTSWAALAISRSARIASGVSIIAHTRVRAGARGDAAACRPRRGPRGRNLGDEDRVGSGHSRGRQVVLAPGRIEAR